MNNSTVCIAPAGCLFRGSTHSSALTTTECSCAYDPQQTTNHAVFNITRASGKQGRQGPSGFSHAEVHAILAWDTRSLCLCVPVNHLWSTRPWRSALTDSSIRMHCIALSTNSVQTYTKLIYRSSTRNRPRHSHLGLCSVDEHPHPLAVQPRGSIEEIMHRLHITLIRLKELELEPPRPEDRSQRHIELCICQI